MEPRIQYAKASDAVNIASRISGLPAAGEVLVSETVRSLARASAEMRFEDRGELAAGKGLLLADIGEVALRGFEDPVRLYEVRWPRGE